MKKIILLFVFVFCAVTVASSQSSEWKGVYSEEFHFLAYFPDEPTYTEIDAETRFGKIHSRRWTLESSGRIYEVSVNDFSNLTVEMNAKSLNSFYNAICEDSAAQYGVKCSSGFTSIMFDEYGRNAGGRGKDVFFSAEMYLARQRLYMLKLVTPVVFERDREKLQEGSKFFEKFSFIHKNEKGLRYGLPETASQNYKFQ